MATVYSTTGCSISVGGTAIGGVIDGTATLTHEPIDATEITDGRRLFIGGVRSGTFQGTIYYNQGDTAQAAMETACANGTAVTILFTLHSGATYSSSAYLTSFAPSFTVNDVTRATFSAQLTGTLTIG
jgi:hypothetical protein